MTITATMVKELRERTGAGMMECKKALVETDGNIETAIENMRKAGQAKADKKASRMAAEGVVFVKPSVVKFLFFVFVEFVRRVCIFEFLARLCVVPLHFFLMVGFCFFSIVAALVC